jgi:porin
MTISKATLIFAALWACLSISLGDEDPPVTTERSRTGGFGGPSSVEEQILEDRRAREKTQRLGVLDEVLEPWTSFKSSLREQTGLSINADYTTLWMWSSSSPGEDRAFGGIGRVFGTWSLVDREGPFAGSLVYKVENRHRLGSDIAPQNLGFASGYQGIPGTVFSDYDGWGVTNLFWQQAIGERFNLVFGQVDATDYLDIYGLTNPWTQFQNLAFLTDPTIAAPSQGLGAAFGTLLTDNIYMIGGFADANGDPTLSPFSTIEDGEFFKHLELGWVSSYERRYLDNVHLTAWHTDEREKAGIPDGWGLAFSATKFVDDKWMPFLRAGYAEGDASLLSHSVSAGVGRLFGGTNDLLGVGLNWGRPADDSLDDQWTSELFYRFQAAQNFAITPSIQLIGNPALNPDKDFLAYFGLRARMTF